MEKVNQYSGTRGDHERRSSRPMTRWRNIQLTRKSVPSCSITKTSGSHPFSSSFIADNGARIYHVILRFALLAHCCYASEPAFTPDQEHLLTDTLLRELINQMRIELVDTADSYLEYPEKAKELPVDLPADYDSMDTLNPNPSIRDQEYLQHSTLWSHQRINDNTNAKSNNRHRIQSVGLKGVKDEKAENPLPAYCTPPNPCPIGYTNENNCLTNFENTATFSRDYQSAQDCMCDTEHMLECSSDTNSNSLSNMHISTSDFDQIVEQFQEENPFFQGEKLPIAAKKGIHVID